MGVGIILKLILKTKVWGCQLCLSGWGLGLLSDLLRTRWTLGSHKSVTFLDQLNNYQLFREESVVHHGATVLVRLLCIITLFSCLVYTHTYDGLSLGFRLFRLARHTFLASDLSSLHKPTYCIDPLLLSAVEVLQRTRHIYCFCIGFQSHSILFLFLLAYSKQFLPRLLLGLDSSGLR